MPSQTARARHAKGVSAELDPRPGGIYRVNITGRDIARGEYLELVPFSRVVFTWGWEDDKQQVPPGSSTVEISLTPDGDTTVLRLRHTGLPFERQESHAHGWKHSMERLSVAAAGGDVGADPWTNADGRV